MAKPSGPKFAPPPVPEPAPGIWDEVTADEIHFSELPPDVQPATEPPPGDREAAMVPPLPPSGEHVAAEVSPEPGTDAAPPARPLDADQMTATAASHWAEMTETRGPDDEVEAEDESSPLFPGRRPLYKRPEPTASAEEQLANVISFLQKLQVTILKAEPAAEPASPAELGLSLLQLRRLSRRGVVPDPFQIGVLPKPWSPPAPAAEPVPASEGEPEPGAFAPTPTPTEPMAAPRPARLERRHAVWLALTGGLCLVTLGLVGYLWMRVGPLARFNRTPMRSLAEHKPAAAPTPGAEVSEAALNLANLALEAIQRGDFKQASDFLDKARKEGVALPGLSYQAALLAFNQGRFQDADNLVEQSIAANDAVSDCWYLRANAAFFTAGPAEAAEDFEQAARASPFSPRFYFFRAECLRRNGNTAAALGQFQQALRCRPNSTDTELILFKIGLTRIESNTDLIFKTELHDRLAEEPVSGDTLLLAAADAISRNEFAEAADALRRAALALPPKVFQSRVRDYVFQAQANRPEIAAVLKLTLPTAVASQSAQPPPKSAGRVLVDPATRTLAEADPAGW